LNPVLTFLGGKRKNSETFTSLTSSAGADGEELPRKADKSGPGMDDEEEEVLNDASAMYIDRSSDGGKRKTLQGVFGSSTITLLGPTSREFTCSTA
jgi:hypothetical protein